MADYTDDPSVLDPAMTLGPDDPLRAWADQNIDWRTGRLLVQDPQAAIESMIKRGISPPDVHAPMAYTDPVTGATTPPPGGGTDSDFPIVRTNKDGTIAGNVTAPQMTPPKPPAIVPAPVRAAAEGGNALDPEENPSPVPQGTVPLPKPREPATDMSAKKKPDAEEALSGFSKSLAGVKPVQPPPVNPVGTPSVRSPTAVSAPNLAQLIALTGNAVPPSVANTLGRLLVAGKA